jgi:CheY-like chemotaxis protein
VPLVLAIEPDSRQADIVKYIVRELVRAELILVASRDEAIAAIDQQLPDVILLTALLSPRDEDELVGHLRRLGAAEHLQTHTIPLLSGSRATEQSGRGGGLLGKFRKKKEAEPIAGCDPEMFAAEIRAFLARADELKAEARESARRAELSPPATVQEPAADLRAEFTPSQLDDVPMAEPLPSEAAAESSWSSPFEWKSSYSASSLASQAKAAEANAQAEKAR